MSKYSDISKRIGWNGHCAIPSPQTAKELHYAVVNEQCEASFEMVFKIHRFAPSPTNKLETEAMYSINKAFITGNKYFQ